MVVGMLGAYILMLMKHPYEAIFFFLAATAILGVGLAFYLRGILQQRRGGEPCQSCGNPDARHWTDEGRKFSICNECVEELNR
jgi:hypothetical protein